MAGDTDRLDIILRVLRAEEAKRDLAAAKAAVSDLDQETRQSLLAGTQAAQGFSGSLKSTYTEMNSLVEIGARVGRIVVQLAEQWNLLVTRNAAVARAEREVSDEMNHLADEFADGFVEAGNIVERMEALDSVLESVGGAARTAGTLLWSAMETVANSVAQYIPGAMGQLSGLLRILYAVSGGLEALGGGEGGDLAAHRRMLEGLAGAGLDYERGQSREGMGLQYSEAGVDEDYLASLEYEAGRQTSIAAGRSRAAALRGAESRSGVIGSVKGGAGAAAAAGGDWRMTKEVQVQAEFERRIAEEYERQLEALDEILEDLDERQELAEAYTTALEAEARWIEENKQAELEAVRQVAQAHQTLHDMDKAQAEERKEYLREEVLSIIDSVAGGIQVASGVIDQLQSREERQFQHLQQTLIASGANQEQIARAVEAHETRLDKLRAAEGGLLIAYNTVKAATEVAEAIASGAKQDYGAAVAHGMAAASYTAAAVMAGLELGTDDGSSATSAPATSQASMTPRRERGEEEDTRRGGSRLQILMMGSDSPEMVNTFDRAEWEFERQGYDGPARGFGHYGA